MSDDFKHPRGVSAHAPRSRPLGRLEIATVAHVAILLIFGAWALGGNTPFVRFLMSCWGSLGFVITAIALRNRSARAAGYHRPIRWLWPFAFFNLLVLVSSFNPSFRELADGARSVFVEDRARWPLPSTARPTLSLKTLWFFDAVYLSCFNLALVVRQRRALRTLLFVVAGNALLLAILGTVQKLIGATGIFFGQVKTPQVFFFSSFIYHNHWGAFTVLMTGVVLGLVFHFARRASGRDFWHSPASLGIVAVVLLATSIPLSGSRSCTILIALLTGGALLHAGLRFRRGRSGPGGKFGLPMVAGIAAVLAVGAFIHHLARPMIDVRVAATQAQVAEMKARGEFLPRATLYRDTWNMAREKIWFGWGMAAYPTVFYLRNSQPYSPIDGLPNYYHDAHSDWLQSVSEVGLIGTALLGLCAVVPLYYRRRVLTQSPITTYLLAGCAILVLYAWLEFPFGNRAVIAAFWTCFFCAVHYGRLDASSNSTP